MTIKLFKVRHFILQFCLLVLVQILTGLSCYAVQNKTVNIWAKTKEMPGTRVIMEVTIPDNPCGTAVIICPGGSYHHLGVYNEGHTTAKWFNSHGATTFVLRYRVAQNNYHYPAMMQDIQRAIQLIRMNAAEYKIDPSKVGIIGFSAGGHLVTWAGAFADRVNELEKIGIHTTVSLRPDFVIPVYPVVTMQEDIGHKWSRKSLLGKNPTQEQKDLFSMEMQIPSTMPPVYLVACHDDPVVIFENSVRLYAALQEKGVNCTFAQYEWGGHGFGMMNNKFMQEFHWNEPLYQWLKELNFLP